MNCKTEILKKDWLLIALLFLSLSVTPSSAQDSGSGTGDQAKAAEILQKARVIINQKKENSTVQKISLAFNVSRSIKVGKKDTDSINQSQQEGEKEFNSILPDKFRYSETLSSGSTSVYQFILNGNKYDAESYGISDGKRIEFQMSDRPTLTEEQKAKLLLIKKKEAFFLLFPVLLESPDFPSLDFKYIGKAESNGERADVLEAVFDQESKIRLFFDEQTHLLKMMIKNTANSQSELEEKRFYSDYKVVEGLMVANKVNVESKQLNKTRSVEITEEQTLKSFKLNPTFKPNLFDIKN